MSDEFEKVRNDHYLHNGFLFLLFLYAWQVHGFIIALLIIVAIFATVITTNSVIMNRWTRNSTNDEDGDTVFRRLKWNRWGWIIAGYVFVALSGAEFSAK